MSSNLPKIRLISVSKPKKDWAKIVEIYESRLNRATSFEHIIVKERGGDEISTRKQTSEAILKHVPTDYFLYLLDERGQQLSSQKFASQITKSQKNLCFVVGSSYGVSDELANRANFVLSLSKFVLAHEIARITLLEQLYRAQAILTNHPYHHE